MSFTFSKHALEQMNERGISKELVTEILNDPLEILTEESNSIYQGLTLENNKCY